MLLLKRLCDVLLRAQRRWDSQKFACLGTGGLHWDWEESARPMFLFVEPKLFENIRGALDLPIILLQNWSETTCSQ
jgi:hypothetical protein